MPAHILTSANSTLVKAGQKSVSNSSQTSPCAGAGRFDHLEACTVRALQLGKLLVSLRGCGCPDCLPPLQAHAPWPPVFSIFTGLSWRSHDASHLATLAASSFQILQLQPTQRQMLRRWSILMSSYRHTSTPVTRPLLQEAADIFSELFFLGQLPASRLQVVTAGTLQNGGSVGKSWPSSTSTQPEFVSLDLSHHALWSMRARPVQVLLHEMAHCFLSRYTCYPWHSSDNFCSRRECKVSWYLNIGPGGHGRAWQYLVKAIEESMPQLLQLPGELGRNCGILTDSLRHGYHMPCENELKRLYRCSYDHENLWRYMRRSRDDNLMEQRILVAGLVQPRRRGQRRASDSCFMLRNRRRPTEQMW